MTRNGCLGRNYNLIRNEQFLFDWSLSEKDELCDKSIIILMILMWFMFVLRGLYVNTHSTDAIRHVFVGFFFITQNTLKSSTHWGRDKWWPFSRRLVQICLIQWKNIANNFTEIFAWGPIYRKSPLVWVMAWGPKGVKPLSKIMMTQLTGAFVRHSVSMN